MVELLDRTGERCVACRTGYYSQVIVREQRAKDLREGTRSGPPRAAWVHPQRVRCGECGATADRWRER